MDCTVSKTIGFGPHLVQSPSLMMKVVSGALRLKMGSSPCILLRSGVLQTTQTITGDCEKVQFKVLAFTFSWPTVNLCYVEKFQ